MTTFVVLLRGINVGGNKKVPMAELRTALADDGFSDVRTYIQSGNVVIRHPRMTAHTVATRVRAVIANTFGFEVSTVAITSAELGKIASANPYAEEPDPRRVHVFFLIGDDHAGTVARLGELEEIARANGGRDSATVKGRALYLHTPDGFGESELAKLLSTSRGRVDATARNWATVTKLQELAAE